MHANDLSGNRGFSDILQLLRVLDDGYVPGPGISLWS